MNDEQHARALRLIESAYTSNRWGWRKEVVALLREFAAEPDAMDELRRSCAQILGTDPETWPNHGNAPLAIAAALALRDNELKRLAAEPERVPLTDSELTHIYTEWCRRQHAPSGFMGLMRSVEDAALAKNGIVGGDK